MKGILKWPLIIAAVVVVLRVVVEQSGASDAVAGLLGVFALHVLIGPLYFAVRIAKSGVPRPYAALFKLVALYAVLVRAMVIPTYWLARIYGWPQSRFAGMADSDPVTGWLGIPFGTAAVWIVASIVFGGIIGSLVVAITRRFAGKTAATGIPSRP